MVSPLSSSRTGKPVTTQQSTINANEGQAKLPSPTNTNIFLGLKKKKKKKKKHSSIIPMSSQKIYNFLDSPPQYNRMSSIPGTLEEKEQIKQRLLQDRSKFVKTRWKNAIRKVIIMNNCVRRISIIHNEAKMLGTPNTRNRNSQLDLAMFYSEDTKHYFVFIYIYIYICRLFYQNQASR